MTFKQIAIPARLVLLKSKRAAIRRAEFDRRDVADFPATDGSMHPRPGPALTPEGASAPETAPARRQAREVPGGKQKAAAEGVKPPQPGRRNSGGRVEISTSGLPVAPPHELPRPAAGSLLVL